MHTRLAALVVSSLLLGSIGHAQEPKKEPDLFTQIRNAGLADKEFTLVVRVSIKPGTEKKFEDQMQKTCKATLLEKGCIAYECHRDVSKPTEYVLFEKWKNLSALEAHFKQAHTAAILKVAEEVSMNPVQIQVMAPLPILK